MFRDDERFACALEALARGDFAQAEAALDALIAVSTQLTERAFLLNKRGVARVGLDLRDGAREDFVAALEAAAEYAPALNNLGNMLLEEGDVESSIAYYERAIASDADYSVAHLNLGVAYKRAGRIAESVRELKHSQRLEERARANASFFSTRSRRR